MIRHALIFWIAVSLAVLGLVTGIMDYGLGWLFWTMLPTLLLCALLIYAYRLTQKKPNGPGRSRPKVKPSQKTMAKVAGVRKTQAAPGKRKTYPFQVIEGSKGKNDEHLPKYH
ncbi:hypothetical protein PAECIP111892_01833 [Paenibacillus auburnensis]|jgi:hypothetical protein|uniref:DUF2207 domain-containing protein n=1 Tax=Paenibacillus auburnensis TaxID=2905649 RepID=A0ABM9BVN0_9BACL|nr:hypothetical protein [Paenibacillus auburnensis]CAH1194746.1 hypothetical protein PAECIP111892_01833 [Paenibacillus auburnensis]